MKSPRVVCDRPGGCGWWWQTHASRPHWWSRKQVRYYGPFWEIDGGCCGGHPRWMSREQLTDEYADCIRHLKASK